MAGKNRANNLVALGSAAVLTVYAAGYARTRSAAERFAVKAEQRRAAEPVASVAAAPAAPEVRVAAIPAGPVAPTIAPVPSARSLPAANPNPRQAAAAESAALTQTLPAEPPPVAPAGAPAAEAEQPVAESAAAAPATQDAQYKDGTYLGWGSCRHGDIQASVVVERGRIVSASIAQCLTRYSCSWIAALPSQVVSRQSVNVDYVSGATQSTDAFADAVVDALLKAK